ncbi:MAG: enoyl-CoA hydratase/isomerase family protein [Chloroflexi bacterium]|nr:enoyl-CoA hydratase/isomerase family protein [Chloroflexota bacterium]
MVCPSYSSVLPFPIMELTIQDHIATITLSRPNAGNAIDEQTAQQLRDLCEVVRQDDDVRVCVITGDGSAEGGVFCTGTEHSGGEPSAEEFARLRVSEAIAAIEKPTIALINGDAIDQGLELALACDLRVVSETARLGLTHLASGIIPWDGGTQRLPRIVGQSQATDMILRSRLLDAQEALEIGLVNHVGEHEEAAGYAHSLATTITSHAPIGARYLKETLMKGADMTLEQGLGLEADLTVILQSTADRAEGIASFLERRQPEYRGE